MCLSDEKHHYDIERVMERKVISNESAGLGWRVTGRVKGF